MLNSYADLGSFDGIACIAGIVHLEKEQLQVAFKNMHECLKNDGYLFVVFKTGGENKYSAVYENQEYARNFIYHTKQEIDIYLKDYFKFVEDLGSQNNWQYLIYKK